MRRKKRPPVLPRGAEVPARRDTPAQRQLARDGWSGARLARAGGFPETTVDLWLAGIVECPEHLRGPIFVLTGVRPVKWRTREENVEHHAAMDRATERAWAANPEAAERRKARAKALPLRAPTEAAKEARR